MSHQPLFSSTKIMQPLKNIITSNTYYQPMMKNININNNNTSNTYHHPTSSSSNRGQALMNAWKTLSCMLRARHRSRVRSFLKTTELAFSTLKGDINRRLKSAWNFKKNVSLFSMLALFGCSVNIYAAEVLSCFTLWLLGLQPCWFTPGTLFALRETLSGLLQTELQDISFPKEIDLPLFPLCAAHILHLRHCLLPG